MPTLKSLIIFFILCYSWNSYTQKEANIWYFGQNAGLDFSSGTPVALTDGQLFTPEGCATISDKNGDLLFYTNGIYVFNRDHNIMLNGTRLLGDNTTIIVPKPDDDDIYYIFTTDELAKRDGLRYSEVDLTLDGGLGGITNKNILLETPVTEKITAIKSPNGYWVISHRYNSNDFIVYEVTPSGINSTPIVSSIGSLIDTRFNTIGSIKISPNGKKIAVANSELNVQLFDFDTDTGRLSNEITLLEGFENYYGIEFSPNSKRLYVSVRFRIKKILQFDLTAGNEEAIINSQVEITNATNPPFGYGQLQLANNGKIYVAKPMLKLIDVINNPNALGLDCNYERDAVSLSGRIGAFGLPTFIQSFFNLSTFSFENICFGDTTQFLLEDTVDSIEWDFGDPASGINNTSTDLEPTHIFSAPGTCDVTATATVGGDVSTETVTVTIFEQPTATQPNNIEICDFFGNLTFNLTDQNAAILNGLDPNDFEITYYEGITNYNDGIPINMPETYSNPSSFFTQEIVAEVYNTENPECTDSTTFNIEVFKDPQLEIPENLLPLIQCDDIDSGADTDTLSEFNITTQEPFLLLNGAITEVTLNYFTDPALTQPITTPAAFQNTQTPQTIYVEAVSILETSCRNTTSFTVEVAALPNTVSEVELQQCDNDTDAISLFNLNEVINEITTKAINETITFFEKEEDAISNTNSIVNTTTYPNAEVSKDIVWARIENNQGCFRTSQVNLTVTTTQIPDTFFREFLACDDDRDGITSFDFSAVEADVLDEFPAEQDLIIRYYRNEDDALAEENSIQDPSNYSNIGYPNTQEIYIRVDSEIDNDCLGWGPYISLNTVARPIANPVMIPVPCEITNTAAFNTNTIESVLLNGQSSVDIDIRYLDSDGLDLQSPLPDPFVTESQTVTARLTNNRITNGSCFDETDIIFTVDVQPIANTVPDQLACDDGVDDTDGVHDFDTSLIEDTLLNGQSGVEVFYFDENDNALTSPLPNPFPTESQTIRAEVVNSINPNCTDTTPIVFTVNPLPEFTIETPQIVCSSDPTFTIVLDPEESDPTVAYSYQWEFEDGSMLSNAPTLTVSTPGTYTITLTTTDGTNCSRSNDVFVDASELANISLEAITIVDASNNNTITIDTSALGLGDYEFALDDELSPYQDDPLFTNVSPGIHTVYIHDKRGCGTASIEVSVIGFPKFFTPNGDGINDFWQIQGVNNSFQTNTQIYIFDRHGKLLKQLNPNTIGWDGIYNGNRLPNNDYWFKIRLEDGRVYTNHFTLKR